MSEFLRLCNPELLQLVTADHLAQGVFLTFRRGKGGRKILEHLMVTAFSKEPPPANVVIDYIDGERYEVFGDAKAVVAQTRGLRKKQDTTGNTEVKVGEAFLTLTTMPAD